MRGIQVEPPRLATRVVEERDRGRQWTCECIPGDQGPLVRYLEYKVPMFDSEFSLGTRMNNQLWVEPVGELVLARLRGMPIEALIVECQRQVLQILRDQGGGKVLYDALEMEAPPVEVCAFPANSGRYFVRAQNPARHCRSHLQTRLSCPIGIWRGRLPRVLHRHAGAQARTTGARTT